MMEMFFFFAVSAGYVALLIGLIELVWKVFLRFYVPKDDEIDKQD